jgi:hypothetical protein
LKDKFGKFEEDLTELQIRRGNNASQIILQKDFLKILDEFELGIGLYEQNSNGDWSEINLDPINPNNTPIKTPCN